MQCHSQLAAGALSKDLISAFKSQKIHVKKDGSVSINSTDTSKDSAGAAAALVAAALLSPSSRPPRTSSRRRPLPPPKTTA